MTGATGFLGNAIAKQYYDQGYEVTVLARNPDKIKNSDYKIITGDLGDFENLKNHILKHNAIDENTIVIHSAAILGADQAKKSKYIKINIESTVQLFQLSKELKANKFVFISSMAACGPIGTLDNPITENMESLPRSYYGWSKHEAESKIIAESNDEIPLIIIRPPIIFGPGMNPGSGAALMFNGCKRRIFAIIGRGNSFIHLAYIDNLVAGIVACTKSVESGTEIFFIADDHPYKVMEVINDIKRELKSKTFIVKIPYLLLFPFAWMTEKFGKLIRREIGFNVELIKGMAKNGYLFSIDKAKNVGYNPRISSEEGIKRTVEYLTQEN